MEYERPYPIDGHVTWMLVRKTGLTRPDGSRVVVLLLLDVTARKAAEERLRASEQRFRSLTQLSADWYWEQDAQLRFTYVSAGGNGNAKVPEAEHARQVALRAATWSGSRRPHARSTWPRCWRAVRSATCWCATAPAASG